MFTAEFRRRDPRRKRPFRRTTLQVHGRQQHAIEQKSCDRRQGRGPTQTLPSGAQIGGMQPCHQQEQVALSHAASETAQQSEHLQPGETGVQEVSAQLRGLPSDAGRHDAEPSQKC